MRKTTLMDRFLPAKELNIIRGKVIRGGSSPAEMILVFEHLDRLEETLDNWGEDFLSTEGWRHTIYGED